MVHRKPHWTLSTLFSKNQGQSSEKLPNISRGFCKIFHNIHKTIIKPVYHLIFRRKHELNAVNLISTHSFPFLGGGGPFVFQLHTLGEVKL